MNTMKLFCEECRNDVDFVVTTTPMTGSIREKEYSFIGQEVHCADCGSQIYVPGISDANLRALYDVYRQANGIIALNQIREIPEKYQCH